MSQLRPSVNIVKVAPKATSAGTESAERVADVLLAFGESDDSIGVSELARRLKLSKAVIYRILRSLASRALIEFDIYSREYRLGPQAAIFGIHVLRQLDLRPAAREELIALRDATRETTTLSQLFGNKRTYAEQFESPQEIKMTVELGRPYPLSLGASSRAILAHLPESEIEQALIGRPVGSGGLPMADEIRKDLAGIRAAGYAISYGQRLAGAASIAVPVFGSEGQAVGSISICGPVARFDGEAVAGHIPLIIAAAARISSSLTRS